MKKYYLHNGTEQQGPFDITDLKAKLIKKDTPIWYEGLSEWKTAGEIEELKEIFSTTTPPPFSNKTATPPPIQNQETTSKNSTPPAKTKSSTGKTIFIILIVLVVVLGGLFVLNNINSGGSYGGSSYQEKVMTVEEIERSQPTNFLSADGTYRENFWGDKIKVNCVIKNSATVATYKDAIVRVTYYSKTKTALGSKEYTVYEVFPPHSAKTIELKIDNYKDVNSIGWDVINATSLR